MSNRMKISRYPGTRPFEAAEKHLFYGREREINDLTRLTILERLVVLFGKSGYGKSSLLQAGVLPKLASQEEVWTPLPMRLGVYNGQMSPCQIVVEHLKRLENKEKTAKNAENTEGVVELKIKNSKLNAANTELNAENTELNTENTEGSFLDDGSLWRSFKKRQTLENSRLLLIFDQFEEFFTYPLAQQKQFKMEMAELLYSSMPQHIVEEFKTSPFEQRRFLARPMNIHVLFSIRSDKLSLLHSLKDALPAILHVRYELLGLSIEQARQAIQQPALADDASQNSTPHSTPHFTSPPFDFEPEALDFMVEKLSERTSEVLVEPQIEAFQLQIVCQEIEDKVIETGKTLVSKADLPSFEAVYEDYYRTQIEKISDPVFKKVARIILEEKLVSGSLDSNSARREPMSGSKLMEEAAATQELLDNLVNFRLLRREPNSLGGDSYEISHDTLIAPVLRSKNVRKAAEKAEEDSLKVAVEKQQLAEKAALERKQLLKKIALIVGLLAALLAISYFYFAKQKETESKAQLVNALTMDNPFWALKTAYASYKNDKTPLSSTILSVVFYNFCKQNDGYIFEEIDLPDNLKTAEFTENGEAIVVNFMDNNVKPLVYDFKTHAFTPFNNQKTTSNSADSLTLFDGKLKAELMDNAIVSIEDNRGVSAEKYQFKTAFEHHPTMGFSIKNKRLLAVNNLATKLQVWYWNDKKTFILRGDSLDFRTAVTLSEEQKNVLATNENKVFLWQNAAQKPVILRGAADEMRDAIFSKNEPYILTLSKLSSVYSLKIFNKDNLAISDSIVVEGKPTDTHEGDNVLLINGDYEDSQLYNFDKGKVLKIKILDGFRKACFTFDKKMIVAIKDSLVVLYKVKTGEITPICTLENALKIRQIVYQPTTKQLLATSFDGLISMVKNGRKSTFEGLKNKKVNVLRLSNDGNYLATAAKGIVQIWNSNNNLIAEWRDDKTDFINVNFSPDDNNIIAVTADKRIIYFPLPNAVNKLLEQVIKE